MNLSFALECIAYALHNPRYHWPASLSLLFSLSRSCLYALHLSRIAGPGTEALSQPYFHLNTRRLPNPPRRRPRRPIGGRLQFCGTYLYNVHTPAFISPMPLASIHLYTYTLLKVSIVRQRLTADSIIFFSPSPPPRSPSSVPPGTPPSRERRNSSGCVLQYT